MPGPHTNIQHETMPQNHMQEKLGIPTINRDFPGLRLSPGRPLGLPVVYHASPNPGQCENFPNDASTWPIIPDYICIPLENMEPRAVTHHLPIKTKPLEGNEG